MKFGALPQQLHCSLEPRATTGSACRSTSRHSNSSYRDKNRCWPSHLNNVPRLRTDHRATLFLP
eukprot:12155609-Alexandrium_andersonii.AAC.1